MCMEVVGHETSEAVTLLNMERKQASAGQFHA